MKRARTWEKEAAPGPTPACGPHRGSPSAPGRQSRTPAAVGSGGRCCGRCCAGRKTSSGEDAKEQVVDRQVPRHARTRASAQGQVDEVHVAALVHVVLGEVLHRPHGWGLVSCPIQLA